MSPERRQPDDAFGFTEAERLHDRVSRERFLALLDDELTAVHRAQIAGNNYGQFAFVTLSRPGEHGRATVTFFSLGYHEHRERWITEDWRWYPSQAVDPQEHPPLPKENVAEFLRERWEEIAPYIGQEPQSERGRLFEMLAEMTDDDAALVELEDMGDAFDWFSEPPAPQDANSTEEEPGHDQTVASGPDSQMLNLEPQPEADSFEQPFPITGVSRADLRQAGFGDEEIGQLDDDDMRKIAGKLADLYVETRFWDDLEYVARRVLSDKRPD